MEIQCSLFFTCKSSSSISVSLNMKRHENGRGRSDAALLFADDDLILIFNANALIKIFIVAFCKDYFGCPKSGDGKFKSLAYCCFY